MTPGSFIGAWTLGVLSLALAMAIREIWIHRERHSIPRAEVRKRRAMRADIRQALKRGRAAR